MGLQELLSTGLIGNVHNVLFCVYKVDLICHVVCCYYCWAAAVDVDCCCVR